MNHLGSANAQGKIEERLARWLLMAHDRVESNDLHLTHEFLAVKLGVRRAGVTTALHQLESQALIAMERGSISVIDREDLEENANGLCGAPEAEFRRLFPIDEGRQSLGSTIAFMSALRCSSFCLLLHP